MIAHGMTPIRYKSDMNEWMDCIIFVPAWEAEIAISAIKKSIEEFWEGCYSTFGEAIEDGLSNALLPYVILYMPWDDVNDCPDESYMVWEKMIDEIWSTTPGVTLS